MGAALEKAKEDAVAVATAKAEIAIEKVLRDLEYVTMRKIKMVSVDTQNYPTPSAEIFWP